MQSSWRCGPLTARAPTGVGRPSADGRAVSSIISEGEKRSRLLSRLMHTQYVETSTAKEAPDEETAKAKAQQAMMARLEQLQLTVEDLQADHNELDITSDQAW